MAEVCGRPGIKGSCGKRRMRLNYLAGDGLRGRFWSFGAASAHLQGDSATRRVTCYKMDKRKYVFILLCYFSSRYSIIQTPQNYLLFLEI